MATQHSTAQHGIQHSTTQKHSPATQLSIHNKQRRTDVVADVAVAVQPLHQEDIGRKLQRKEICRTQGEIVKLKDAVKKTQTKMTSDAYCYSQQAGDSELTHGNTWQHGM